MEIFKKLCSIMLVVLVILLPVGVSADEFEAQEVMDKIVTEYHSVDLTDPPVGIIETVGPIGSALDIPAKSCINNKGYGITA